MNIRARQRQCISSTVVRFARSMGYDKYGQMLISIARDQQSGSQSLDLTAGPTHRCTGTTSMCYHPEGSGGDTVHAAGLYRTADRCRVVD